MPISVAKLLIICATVFLLGATATVGGCAYHSGMKSLEKQGECVKLHKPAECRSLY